MWRLRLAMFLTLTGTMFAQDAQLEALRETLTTLRKQTKGAAYDTPAPAANMAKAKHQLRDWVESKLVPVKEREEITALETKLNQELQTLSMPEEPAPEATALDNRYGTLSELRLTVHSGILVVSTALGILCQYDESLYGYKPVDGGWKRIWESEQQDYSEAKYKPQSVFQVNAWQQYREGQEAGPIYIMTLGNQWGCASTWHPVYYRVWRVTSSGSRLLIDGEQFAWMRVGTYAVGSIGQQPRRSDGPMDVLIEVTVGSVDVVVHNRQAILRYLIEGDKVRRVAPVALSPRDFVDEWLTHDWKEAAAWSIAEAVRPWHRKLHADWVGGSFPDNTKRCETPGLWQVTFAPSEAKKNYEDQAPLYFLVEWRPPFHFAMKEISPKPWPHCTQDDPEADEWRTLFNTQEWRN